MKGKSFESLVLLPKVFGWWLCLFVCWGSAKKFDPDKESFFLSEPDDNRYNTYDSNERRQLDSLSREIIQGCFSVRIAENMVELASELHKTQLPTYIRVGSIMLIANPARDRVFQS